MALVLAVIEKQFAIAEQLLDDPEYDVNETGFIKTLERVCCSKLCDYENVYDDYPDYRRAVFNHVFDFPDAYFDDYYDDETRYHYDLYGTPLMALATSDWYDDILNGTLLKKILNHPKCDINYKICCDSEYAFHPVTAIQYAVFSANCGYLKIILGDERCDINTTNHKGFTALHIASRENYYEICQILLDDPRCNPNHTEEKRVKPCCLAVSEGHYEIAKMFIKHPKFDVNSKEINYGESILHYTIRTRHFGISHFVLNMRNLNINLKNEFGSSTLHIAANSGNKSIFKRIISHPKCILDVQDSFGMTVAAIAAKRGDVKMINILMQKECDFNIQDKNGYSPIFIAVINRNIQVAKVLLNNSNCDVNVIAHDDKNILHHAGKIGNINMVSSLLKCKRLLVPFTDSKSFYIVSRVVCERSEDKKLFQIVLKSPFVNHCDDYSGKSLLHMAVKNNNTIMFEQILQEKKVNTNLRDFEDRSALCYALSDIHRTVWDVCDQWTEKTEMFKIMIRSGRFENSMKYCNKFGESILSSYLYIFGDCHLYSNDFWTELDFICQSKDAINASPHTLARAVEMSPLYICKKLLAYGVNVNGGFKNNETALHCAVRIKSLAKIRLLLSYGADRHNKWNELNPLELAINIGCNPKILQELGKDECMDIIETCLCKLCFNDETPEQVSERLNMSEWAEYFKTQNEYRHKFDTDQATVGEQLKQWNRFVERCSTETICVSKYQGISLREFNSLAFYCHEFDADCEAKSLIQAATSLLNRFSEEFLRIPKFVRFAFIPILSGSMVEGSKHFMPNELDFLCKIVNTKGIVMDYWVSNPVVYEDKVWGDLAVNDTLDQTQLNLCPLKFSLSFYKAFDAICKKLNHMSFGRLSIHSYSLERRNKISCLRLLWRGEIFKRMIVNVDLVPAIYDGSDQYHCIIARVPRNGCNSQGAQFTESKRKLIGTLNYYEKAHSFMPGFIIAKALRIAAIAFPEHQDNFLICDDLDIQDIIVTHMLKMCYFEVVRDHRFTSLTAYVCARIIYEKLRKIVLENDSLPYEEGWIICRHPTGVIKEDCCLHRGLIVAVCDKILLWLKKNQRDFEKVEKEIPRRAPYSEIQARIERDRIEYDERKESFKRMGVL